MRVLGENKEGFIVSLSREELANVLGIYNKFSDEFNGLIKQANNVDIPVSKIYKNYIKVRSIVSTPEYDKAITKLKNMQQALESIDPLIQTIKKKYEDN